MGPCHGPGKACNSQEGQVCWGHKGPVCLEEAVIFTQGSMMVMSLPGQKEALAVGSHKQEKECGRQEVHLEKEPC